jgi:hypothetical protein
MRMAAAGEGRYLSCVCGLDSEAVGKESEIPVRRHACRKTHYSPKECEKQKVIFSDVIRSFNWCLTALIAASFINRPRVAASIPANCIMGLVP